MDDLWTKEVVQLRSYQLAIKLVFEEIADQRDKSFTKAREFDKGCTEFHKGCESALRFALDKLRPIKNGIDKDIEDESK